MKKKIIFSCVVIFSCIELKAQQIDNVMKKWTQNVAHNSICDNKSDIEERHGMPNKTMITSDASQSIHEYKTKRNERDLSFTYWFWNDVKNSNYNEIRQIRITYAISTDMYTYNLKRYDDNGKSRCK